MFGFSAKMAAMAGRVRGLKKYYTKLASLGHP